MSGPDPDRLDDDWEPDWLTGGNPWGDPDEPNGEDGPDPLYDDLVRRWGP